MIVEKIIFNFLALFLFVYIFFIMIKRNDTSYISTLVLQAFGIGINFLEIISQRFTGIMWKIIMYSVAIFLPVFVIYMERKNVRFLELRNIFLAKLCMLLKNDKIAKKLLNSVINKYPNTYKAHKMLAEIYEKEGGMRKAIDEYVKAVDINKTDYLSYYKIGDLLYGLGQKDEASTILNNLLRSKPDYYDASILLGEILLESDNYKEAINVYTAALKYKPNDYNLYYSLGISYTLLNDFKNAKECYDRAATINHLLYNAQFSLGQIALIYHDIEKAEEYFLKSLDSNEIDAKAYYELAKIYMLKNERDKSIIFINKSIELDREMYKKSEKEPIFVPIRKYIVLPVQEGKKQKKKERRIELKVEKHLEDTFRIIEGMGIRGIADNFTAKENIKKEINNNKVINKEKEQ